MDTETLFSHVTAAPARTMLEKIGGGGRDRTDDLKLAKLPLSQLSYAPFYLDQNLTAKMVGLGRLELPTSRLSGVRSNHLSYRPPNRYQVDKRALVTRERETKAAVSRVVLSKLRSGRNVQYPASCLLKSR